MPRTWPPVGRECARLAQQHQAASRPRGGGGRFTPAPRQLHATHACASLLFAQRYQYNFLDGERHHTYLYKANYNEYRPRKLQWFEGISPPPPSRGVHSRPTLCRAGKADAHIDTALVPNAVFHYDISPVMVVVREETQAFATFVTKICAVIGGIYTVLARRDR